ncbi:uncharacterized protein LOC116024534 [Ipomoea triloba]|uniref:uncharacterized protein LOC116024534 n=1 Tax=Ipomoea triloba TaxID=35885 RepID=UPI00125D9309|nr:uncharacterized protein LOC116024534 [Ipomoea triloba]
MATYHREFRTTVFILLLFFTVNAFTFSSADTPSESTVYEVLTNYSLPIGLLPDCVTSYTLSDDGSFEVFLEKACYVQFDYLVYYEEKITGKLGIGSITDLDGIQVKRFWFWFDVDEIRVDLPPSDSIYFQVGIINKQLDVDQFQTVHTCQDSAFTLCGVSPRKFLQPAVYDLPMLLTE